MTTQRSFFQKRKERKKINNNIFEQTNNFVNRWSTHKKLLNPNPAHPFAIFPLYEECFMYTILPFQTRIFFLIENFIQFLSILFIFIQKWMEVYETNMKVNIGWINRLDKLIFLDCTGRVLMGKWFF